MTPRKVLQFVHEIVTALASNYQIMAFKLFLECAKTADNCKYDSIAYEFITQAFTLYDDAAFQSVHQVELLTLLIGTLCSLQHISASNYSSLITKNTQYAAKLNKKVEQCRMVAECSHLFWKTHIESVEECNATCANFQDGSKVLECLQRSLTIAELCVNTSSRNVHLFIDLLDKVFTLFYMKFFLIVAIVYLFLQSQDLTGKFKMQHYHFNILNLDYTKVFGRISSLNRRSFIHYG